GGVFADYSQWEAWRDAPASEKRFVADTPEPVRDAPKRKLSYLEQREWDGMEARILEAEQELAARQLELQEAASTSKGLPEAYQKLQDVQRLVEDLYERWAELETKFPR
ncbi:MAG TPA: ABC transporter C-terminal domain-containing protein, partial [Bryobacteraceae bacterium]|nr:ABC transporter C-terminal domain-containing protein [Bryobacteraceae bacterium]